ncbi:MAG: GAF domain-containing protein [Anaerolineae bacterium]|nr:GAF domain-containing protein [Anaerolineae bacterium]
MVEIPSSDSLLRRNELLSQEIRRRVDQLSALNTVAATVSQSLDLQATLQTALQAVLKVIPVDSAGISLVDEAAGELVLRAQHGWYRDFVTQPMRIPLGRGMSGFVVANDEVLVTGDLTGDPRLAVPEFADEGVQAQALVPMHARGRVVGILSVMSHQPYEFADDEIRVLRAIADQVGVALDNARLYESTKEQSSQLEAILNSTGDAIIATDNHGNISLINATAEQLFSLRQTEVMGLPLRQAPLHPKLRAGLRRAMNTKKSGDTVFEVPLDDGRFLSAIVSPVYAHQEPESDRQAEGWVMVVQDVTHLRKAEQARVNFIRDAAHDLRNPLGVTLNALSLLSEEWGESSSAAEIIDIGLQGLNRMQSLIDSLLNLEHIESGVGLQCKDLDVRDLIERCVADIKPSIVQRGQTLRVEVPDMLPLIQGDMQWMYRALINLLSNAHKYTPEGGAIAVCAYVQDEDLFVEVKDNGPGIPPEAQTRLFERFYRVPGPDQDIKGTGLGLAIVKTVVEQHGGRVFVQSKVGQGSIFGMALPLSGRRGERRARAS